MEAWMWIVVVIVVVVIVAIVAVMVGKRRNQGQRVEKAAELRTRGQEEDLRAKEHAAEAARQQADAQRARMEADRLENEAQQRAAEADRARAASQTHLEDATRLDPRPIDEGPLDDAAPVADVEPRRVDDSTVIGDDRRTG